MGLDQWVETYDPTHPEDENKWDECAYFRKNYVLRQWVRNHMPGYVDNGVTPLGMDDLRALRWDMLAIAKGDSTPRVETPDCWYKHRIQDTVSARQTRDDAEYVVEQLDDYVLPLADAGTVFQYREWY